MSGPGFGFGYRTASTRRHRPRQEAPSPAFTASFTLSQFAAHEARRIHQRATTSGGGTGKGQGTVRVPISAASAGTVGARIRSEDGTTILQPEWRAGTVTNGATFIDVAGIDARLGWFYVDLKGEDGNWQLGTVKVGMGALFAFAGQSLMTRMFGRQDGQSATYASLGVTPDPNSAVLACYNGGWAYMPTVATMPWQTPGDVGNANGPNSVGIGEFLNRMIALLGINCGGIGYGHDGSAIQQFFVGNSRWTTLSDVISRAGGAFEAFVWGQGHSNSITGLPAKAYANALTTLFGQISAVNGFAGYGKYIWTIPAVQSSSWGTPFTYNNIRKGADDWCATNGGVHVHAYDIAQVDAVHESQAGALSLARHIYRAARARYGASGGSGPKPLSATRSGTTITLSLSDVGQTTINLVGTPGNRIFVFPRGRVDRTALSDNRFPVASVSVVDKTTLSIVLANDPGSGHELDLYLYWPNGPANATSDNLYDDRTDGDGLTTGRIFQANFTPVAIAAPTPGGAVNPPPGGFAARVSPFNMAETGTSYAASDGGTSFGQQMTGGTAIAPVNSCPIFAPFTIESFFTCPTLSGTQVLFGGIGNGAGYLGISSLGKMVGHSGASGLSSSTVLVPGRRYHVAYQNGPSGRALYLTDISSGGMGTRDAFNPTPETLTESGTRYGLRNNGGSYAITGGGAIDQVAVFYGERHAGGTYSCPSAPFTGTEPDIVALYHCDGDGKDAVAA
ncbi:MAG: hypothetical protein J0G94_16065 [Sphingomonadales bacterium]|nr:hypothetical protein [Sphingomonadales bacterium]